MTAPDEYAQPKSVEYFKPREHLGELLEIEYVRYLPRYATQVTNPGEEGGAEAHVLIMDGPMAGTYYPDQVFTQQQLRSSLRSLAPGQKMLTRIHKAPDARAFTFLEWTQHDYEVSQRFKAAQQAGQAVSTDPSTPVDAAPVVAPTDDQAAFRAWQAQQGRERGAAGQGWPARGYAPPTYGNSVPAAAGADGEPPF